MALEMPVLLPIHGQLTALSSQQLNYQEELSKSSKQQEYHAAQ